MDAIIVCGTIGLGILVGRLLKIDRSIALLTACGSAICGAAAVLGVDGAIRPGALQDGSSRSHRSHLWNIIHVPVPILDRAGIFAPITGYDGLFTGSTVHEVAHVVGAANAMGAEVSNNAIIVKMIRVMMLVPVLLVIAWPLLGMLPKETVWKILIPTSLKSAFHRLPFSSWLLSDSILWACFRKAS